MASWVNPHGHSGLQKNICPFKVTLFATYIKGFCEFVQFPSNITPGKTLAVTPMLKKTKKKRMTNIWKKTYHNSVLFFDTYNT